VKRPLKNRAIVFFRANLVTFSKILLQSTFTFSRALPASK
jgi:hypothetical protein